MKKYCVLVICMVALLASCKKNNDVAPSNTISATIDGVYENFNTDPYAQLSTGVTLNSVLSAFGTNGTGSSADGMSINLSINQSVTKGSYTSGSDAVGLVSITYNSGPFSLANLHAYSTDVSSNQTTVIITALSGSNVQGTFSGKLTGQGLTKTVTNGKFNLALK